LANIENENHAGTATPTYIPLEIRPQLSAFCLRSGPVEYPRQTKSRLSSLTTTICNHHGRQHVITGGHDLGTIRQPVRRYYLAPIPYYPH